MDYTYIIWTANTPNSSILTGASILSHPFWNTPKLYIYKLCFIHVNIQNIHKWWGSRGSWLRMLPSKHGLSENAGTQWALFVRMKQHCILHHRAVVQFKGCGPIHWLLFGTIIPWYFSSNPNLTSINFMLASSIIFLLPHLSTYQWFINCLSKKMLEFSAILQMFPAMQGDLQVGHAAKGLRKALDRTASDPRKAGADAWRFRPTTSEGVDFLWVTAWIQPWNDGYFANKHDWWRVL